RTAPLPPLPGTGATSRGGYFGGGGAVERRVILRYPAQAAGGRRLRTASTLTTRTAAGSQSILGTLGTTAGGDLVAALQFWAWRASRGNHSAPPHSMAPASNPLGTPHLTRRGCSRRLGAASGRGGRSSQRGRTGSHPHP